jgi:Cu/Zn superoxide dismutase
MPGPTERNAMTPTFHRVLAMPAIVAIAGFTATGPAAAGGGPLVRSAGPLSDLQPAAAGPFDAASAAVQIVSSGSSSHTVLRVRGIEGAEGQTFGAHLHAGPCVAGQPAAALGHYNTDVLAGVVPPEVSERTEVWLDFTVEDGGGTATASVPFVPRPGTRSIVIHAAATDHTTGTAGARLACLPVVW